MDNSSFSNPNQTSAIEENGKNILIIVLDSLILLLSLSGNSLVIYTISKERKLQTTCNYLLLNLAICDIIVVSLGTSIDILLQFTKTKWILGLAMCRTLSPAMTMFYISGSLILVVISLDRYKMFVHPLRARYQRKHVKYAVIVVHSISFLCVLPFAVFSTITDGHCYDVWPAIWYRKGYTVFLFVMQYALPLLIMGVAYVGVALSLMRSKSAFKKNFNIGRREKHETTSVKSLVGAVSSSSPSHSKNNVNLVTEQHEMIARSRLLGHGSKRAKYFSGEPSVLECDVKESCVSCEQMCSRKRYTRTEESIVGDCETAESFTSKAGKPNRCKIFIPCQERELSDYSHLIGKSQTESRSNGQKSTTPSEHRLEQANNNVEAHTCGKATLSAPSKRRFSDRLPTYRRNAIRRRSPVASSKSRNSMTPSKRDKRNNHALRMILLVVVVFTLFMLPMQIMSLLLDFAGKPTPEKYKIYAWFVMCSYFGSCTLNPFIYGLVDRTFRAGFKKFGKKVAGLCRLRGSQDR